MEDQGESNRAIKVKMLMFGPLAEKMGTREIDVSLIDGTSLNDLAMQFELVEMLSSGLRVAVDGHLETDLSRLLHDAAEVAFLPPVSGG
ncbi:MAG: MoaD/ThiS family protein [Candidatus Thalassarchaeaceae archaeon]|jgi:molybdopterin converting factor small subunit|nr:MoaD/ThiS family protein [Candidatus Thalassarchaeaceae archaeon]|tara:strand:- start:54 stop:320 length:267 start_codon:yes stop_codon:yes gene_type:complete